MEKVLVVEKDFLKREIFTAILRSLKFRVFSAHDFECAKRILRHFKLSIVFSRADDVEFRSFISSNFPNIKIFRMTCSKIILTKEKK